MYVLDLLDEARQKRIESGCSRRAGTEALTEEERQVLDEARPLGPERMRDANQCGLGAALALFHALASRWARCTTHVDVGNVRATHEVTVDLVVPCRFNGTVVEIIKAQQPFTIIWSYTRVNSDWIHHKADTVLKDIVRGTGVGLHFRSRYSEGGPQFHFFVVDFDIHALFFRVQSRFNNKHVLQSKDVASWITLQSLRDRYGNSDHARKFSHVVKGVETMGRTGTPVARPFQTDDGAYEMKVDKNSIQSVALEAIYDLFDYRVGAFSKKKNLIFDGSHVTVEVVARGAYSEIEAMQLKESWLGTWRVNPVSFPTALDTKRDEFAYRPSSAVFGTLLHKNLATLLQLFLFTDSTFRSVCMGVFFHRDGEVRCHAYLQVGIEDELAWESTAFVGRIARELENHEVLDRFDMRVDSTVLRRSMLTRKEPGSSWRSKWGGDQAVL